MMKSLFFLFISFSLYAVEKPDCPMIRDPLAVWQMKNKKQVSLCDYNGAIKVGQDDYSGWINVVVKGEKPLLPEVDSELPSEFISFRIHKANDSQIKISRNVHSTSGDPTRVISTAVLSCSASTCFLAKETCSPLPKGKIDSQALKEVNSVLKGTKKVKDLGFYDVTLKKVIDSAINGSSEARNLILKQTASSLKTDGNASEILQDGQAVLGHLLKIGCLK